ncbi:DUF389 domain-containing protein [Gaopeijia maritima]|uniref:DUF389 domain-containing protein n=1 Tax=Gaopeijia maritima TaxID=3119007 RepID=UPI00329229B0
MTPPSSDDSPSGVIELFHRFERWVHGRLLRMLNLQAHERETQVHLMLANRQRGVVEYWTFLFLSMSIATLGLAMNSTAVVIGAMLVSPLMGPIVEFAMGLVVGSPVLTVRSTIRITGSLLLVIGGAALITLVLPFREVTAEIAARTHPTLLDMALAVCVALAAALTTVKAKSETNVVASGAAIGIALVPPICVVGFGLGIGDMEIARGALLLLVTNFFAIVSVGAVFFYLLGFEQVSVQAWDDEALAASPEGGVVHRALRALEQVFGSRRSGVFRIALPAVLLIGVAVPLYSGLMQVSWEARTRAAVSRILDQAESEDDFDASWTVAGGQVQVRTYLVGSVERADSLEARLATRIAAASGVEPDVRVTPMPSYEAIARAVEPLRAQGAAAPVADATADLAALRRDLASALAGAWPVEAYGPLAGWSLQMDDQGGVELVLRHLGPQPDAGAGRLLASALESETIEGLRVRFTPLDTATVEASVDEVDGWLTAVEGGLQVARRSTGITLCVQVPDSATLAASTAALNAVRRVDSLRATAPGAAVEMRRAGTSFTTRLRPAGAAPSCVELGGLSDGPESPRAAGQGG